MTFLVVTGAIGSGKSSLSNALQQLGAMVFNADSEVHRLYREDATLQSEISNLVGMNLVLPDGSLDRKSLGEMVFSNDFLRLGLESLVHPKVQESFRKFLEAHPQQVVVYDVSFYRPTAVPQPDLVIWVQAPSEIRIERLVQRGLTREDAEQRIRIQDEILPKPVGNWEVFENDGSRMKLESFAREIWHKVQQTS